jgi:hypothetical protein
LIVVLQDVLFGLPTFQSEFPSVAFVVAGGHVYFIARRVTRWITLWDREVIQVKSDQPRPATLLTAQRILFQTPTPVA